MFVIKQKVINIPFNPKQESTIASSSVIDAVAATANTAAAVPALNLPPLPAATTSTSTYAEAVQAPAPLPVAAAPVAPVAAAPVVPVAAAPIAPVAATAAAPVQSREIPTEKPSLSTTSSALPTTSTTIKETASTEKKPSAAAAASTTDKELKEALEKIAKLEKELNNLKMEEGLRARNGGGRKLAPTVQPLDAVHQHLAALETPRPTEGYPPQVVMGVALLVFIFTYLFF